MNISVVGTGYVGLVVGVCMADLGHNVTCVDNDEGKVAALNAGRVPIYEPGLEQLLERNAREGRLTFTQDLAAALTHSRIVFVAVGTPSAADGSADLSGIFNVARQVAKNAAGDVTLIIKSTVPVGTADKLREVLSTVMNHRYDVVSNPEFLKEGAAIDDFLRPDRIVIGVGSAEARKVMEDLYAPLVRTGKPVLFMDNRSAELCKYAANAFLATRISFINEIAALCNKVGADVDMVRLGAGSDSRIGGRFFFPGAGYGGSCFPKDVRALVETAKENGIEMKVVTAVESVNERQKHLLADMVIERFGKDLSGLKFCLWGLAFKPETDDMREAPALTIIERILAAGGEVVAYDPEAMTEAKRVIKHEITYATGAMDAATGADAVLIVTEWNEFRSPNLEKMKGLVRRPIVFDGRNVLSPTEARRLGFEYRSIGRP
ncbi:MAG: UDP-glucose/GDP-mannose dehydrogenase family protein [Pseudomonadota bacterium]|nr:UDP-glucose/GDP-mannose dehydrogenase family protein [Pseudomonadota bacterium]